MRTQKLLNARRITFVNSGIEPKQDTNEVTTNEVGSSQLGILFYFK